MVGIIIQVMDDGILAPSSLFFITVALQIIITGLLHPQEVGALPAGLVYYITIPSMYMLLVIYSLFNMNDVSWGTRENAQPELHIETPAAQAATASQMSQSVEGEKQNSLQKLFAYLQNTKNNVKDEVEGSLDLSFAGLFRCMLCTHKKPSGNDIQQQHLIVIGESLNYLNSKMRDLEA